MIVWHLLRGTARLIAEFVDHALGQDKAWGEAYIAAERARLEELIRDPRSHELRPRDWSDRQRYVLQRDGYRCTKCGATRLLQVHHKVPVSVKPDHSGGNLTTLCAACHSREPGRGHGDGLLKGAIGIALHSKARREGYIKRKARKNWTCGSCQSLILKGAEHYAKEPHGGPSARQLFTLRQCRRCFERDL